MKRDLLKSTGVGAAWGVGIYENDSAVKWVKDERLSVLKKIELALNGLYALKEGEDAELEEMEVVVAANTLAVLRGHLEHGDIVAEALLSQRLRLQNNLCPNTEDLTALAKERLGDYLEGDHFEEEWFEDQGLQRAEVVRGVLARLERPPKNREQMLSLIKGFAAGVN